MLSIKNLHVRVEDKPILKGINLEIGRGEVHAIMGPNGSGKSTLSHVLAGRDGYEVTDGEVIYNGIDLLELEPDERAHAGVFLAFQYPVEIPGVNCQERTRAELIESLRTTLREALEFNRREALEAAGEDFGYYSSSSTRFSAGSQGTGRSAQPSLAQRRRKAVEAARAWWKKEKSESRDAPAK